MWFLTFTTISPPTLQHRDSSGHMTLLSRSAYSAWPKVCGHTLSTPSITCDCDTEDVFSVYSAKFSLVSCCSILTIHCLSLIYIVIYLWFSHWTVTHLHLAFVQLAFTPRSNDSAVFTIIYRFQLWSETWPRPGNANFHRFSSTMLRWVSNTLVCKHSGTFVVFHSLQAAL